MTLALVDRFRRLPPEAREAFIAYCAKIPGKLSDVRYDWEGVWAQPHQLVDAAEVTPGRIIVFTGPRGLAGKTRSATQLWLREIYAGRATRPRFFAASEADVDKAVVHGESGIMRCLPKDMRPRWIADEGPAGVLRFPNGVEAVGFTAKVAEGAVSHNGDLDLCDDIAKWGPQASTVWSHQQLSCRVGYGITIVATTRRGTVLLRSLLGGKMGDDILIRRPEDLKSNRYNLTSAFYRKSKLTVDGPLGQQELDDEDVSAASPFAGLEFDTSPIRLEAVARGDFEEIVVAVDEAGGKGGHHDLWGVMAEGRRPDKHVVALEDASGSYDDGEAGEAILALCERWGATKIIAEKNRGARVFTVIRAAWWRRVAEKRQGKLRAIPEIIGVVAKEQKRLRAGELRPLYLGGMLHHGPGLGLLERQQREWDPDAPPRPRVDDRIDAHVHAVHYLAALGDGTEAEEERKAEEARQQLEGLAQRNQQLMAAPSPASAATPTGAYAPRPGGGYGGGGFGGGGDSGWL